MRYININAPYALPIPIYQNTNPVWESAKKTKKIFKARNSEYWKNLVSSPKRDVKTGGEIHNKRISIYCHRPDELGSNKYLDGESNLWQESHTNLLGDIGKKGSSNLKEQQRVLGKILTVLSGHKIVVLGDREFCSVSLGKCLQKPSLYFCLRQKKSTEDKRRNLSRNERVRFKSRNSTIFEGCQSDKRAGIWTV